MLFLSTLMCLGTSTATTAIVGSIVEAGMFIAAFIG